MKVFTPRWPSSLRRCNLIGTFQILRGARRAQERNLVMRLALTFWSKIKIAVINIGLVRRSTQEWIKVDREAANITEKKLFSSGWLRISFDAITVWFISFSMLFSFFHGLVISKEIFLLFIYFRKLFIEWDLQIDDSFLFLMAQFM